MIIDDLDIRRAARAARLLEAEAPPVVDADAELANAIAFEGFEPVATQSSQIVETRGGIKNFQVAVGLPGKTLKLADEAPRSEIGRSAVPIIQDHRQTLRDLDALRRA